MFNYIEPDLLESVLSRYCHVEMSEENWRTDLREELAASKFPQREKEFRHQLAYAIFNQTISPSQYEKLTDLELETNEEVVEKLKELWTDLYDDEPVSLGSL